MDALGGLVGTIYNRFRSNPVDRGFTAALDSLNDAVIGGVGKAQDQLTSIGGNIVDRVRFAGDVFAGNKTDEEIANAVADNVIGIPSIHTLPIRVAEKVTGVPVREGFRDGVVIEKGDPTGRHGEYELRIPPMPF